MIRRVLWNVGVACIVDGLRPFWVPQVISHELIRTFAGYLELALGGLP